MPVLTRRASQSLPAEGDNGVSGAPGGGQPSGAPGAGQPSERDRNARPDGLITSTRSRRGVPAKGNSKGSQSWSAGQAPVTRSRRAVPDIAPQGGRRGGARGVGRKAGAAGEAQSTTGRGARGGLRPRRGGNGGAGRGRTAMSEEHGNDCFYDDPGYEEKLQARNGCLGTLSPRGWEAKTNFLIDVFALINSSSDYKLKGADIYKYISVKTKISSLGYIFKLIFTTGQEKLIYVPEDAVFNPDRFKRHFDKQVCYFAIFWTVTSF